MHRPLLVGMLPVFLHPVLHGLLQEREAHLPQLQQLPGNVQGIRHTKLSLTFIQEGAAGLSVPRLRNISKSVAVEGELSPKTLESGAAIFA